MKVELLSILHHLWRQWLPRMAIAMEIGCSNLSFWHYYYLIQGHLHMDSIAPVGGPGSHWPHPQLTTADWSHLCHTSITPCLSQSVKGTILHQATVSRGNPFNNDISSWAPTGTIFSATPGWAGCSWFPLSVPTSTRLPPALFDIPGFSTGFYFRQGLSVVKGLKEAPVFLQKGSYNIHQITDNAFIILSSLPVCYNTGRSQHIAHLHKWQGFMIKHEM